MSIKPINIVILAAGTSSMSAIDGGYPQCLTEIDDRPLLELIVEKAASIPGAKFTFAMNEDDVSRFHLDRIAELLAPGSSVVRVPAGTRGSACSALMAAAALPADEEVLVVSANELIDIRLTDVINGFRQRNLDGGTMVFPSIHPRYSYVRLGDDGLVLEASQRQPISKNATVGIFWFARAGALVDAIKAMIRKDASVDGAFFVAKAFNEMILKQMRIGVLKIDQHQYHPLKTEHQLFAIDHHEVAA